MGPPRVVSFDWRPVLQKVNSVVSTWGKANATLGYENSEEVQKQLDNIYQDWSSGFSAELAVQHHHEEGNKQFMHVGGALTFKEAKLSDVLHGRGQLLPSRLTNVVRTKLLEIASLLKQVCPAATGVSGEAVLLPSGFSARRTRTPRSSISARRTRTRTPRSSTRIRPILPDAGGKWSASCGKPGSDKPKGSAGGPGLELRIQCRAGCTAPS